MRSASSVPGSTMTGNVGSPWLPTQKIVAAAGSTLGTATAIPAGQDLTIVTTGTGGVNLPTSGVGFNPCEEYVVANHTGSNVNVYPGTAQGVMGTASAGAAYSLAPGKTGYFLAIALNTWTVCP